MQILTKFWLAIIGAFTFSAGFALYMYSRSLVVLWTAVLLTNPFVDTSNFTSLSTAFKYQATGISVLSFGVLIFIIGLIAGLRGKTNIISTSEKTKTFNPNAIFIAQERYAKGEITQEQYEQIKKEFC